MAVGGNVGARDRRTNDPSKDVFKLRLVLEIRKRKRLPDRRAPHAGYDHQFLLLRHAGKWAEQNALDPAEYRGIGANAQGQRQHGDCAEPPVPAHSSQTEANVLPDGVTETCARRVAAHLAIKLQVVGTFLQLNNWI